MVARWQRAALAAAIAAAALALWLRYDTSSLPEVTRYRDDAYYYFVFVRSLATGQGPCVTPGEPTNGVHALWAVLLWPLWLAAGDRGLVVLAQHLGLCLHALTAAGLLVLLGGGSRAIVVAALYLGNPTLITEAQNGQETALACFATLLLWWGFGRGAAAAAVVAVLAVLSRSDLIFLVPAFGVAAFGWRARALVPGAVALAAYAGVDLALAGRWLQDSAAPIPWLFAAHFELSHPDWSARLHRLWWYLRPCLLGAPFATVSAVFGAALVATSAAPWLRARWHAVPLFATALGYACGARDVTVPLVASVLLLLAAPVRQVHGGAAYPAALLGFAGIVFLHLVLRTYPRDYYFAPLGVLGALAFGGLSSYAARAAAVLLLAGNLWQAATPAPLQTWQEQMAMAGRYLRTVVPAGEPVGCFNSGIVAFHDPGPVRNLDGVVDHAAFEALQAGRLDAYLDSRHVRFLVDSPEQVATGGSWPHASGMHFGPGFDPDADLVEVARFVVPQIGGTPFTAWWRRGRGAPPPPPAGAPAVLGPAPAYPGRTAGLYVLWPAAGAGELQLGPADGTGPRRRLAAVEAPTTVVVRVDAPSRGRHGLFVAGTEQPILVVDL